MPAARRGGRRRRTAGAPLSTAEHGRTEGQRRRCPEEGRRGSRRRSGRGRRRARRWSRRAGPRAARGAPRAARRCGRRRRPAVRTNQACSAGSSIVSIGATAPPTRSARNRAGSSMAPKWRPTKMTGVAGERLGHGVRGLDRQARVEVTRAAWPASGRPRGSSARRAGRPADEPLEGARVGRGGRRARAVPATRRPRSHVGDPPEVAAGLGGPLGRRPVPQVAGELGQARRAGASGRWQASHDAAMSRPGRAEPPGHEPATAALGPRPAVRDPACRPA